MKFKTLRPLLFLFLLALLLTASCSDDEPGNRDNFDRESMIENLGYNIILPAYENFETETAALEAAVSSLSNEVNATNLDKAQQAWLDAAQAWSNAEMYMMGPIFQMAISASIQNWPTSTAGIEEAIDTNEEITNAYIENLSSSRKGLPAIEYLLFDFTNGDQAILDQLSTSANRRAYLEALTENLNAIAESLNQAWQPDGGNYISTFTSATGKDVASSANVLANDFLILIEKIKNLKLGTPLGKKSMGTPLPENVEARFSGESLKLIHANLNAIEDVFLGTGVEGDQLGYADYLNELNATYNGELLAEVIQSQIATLRSELQDINDPLKLAIDNQTQQVEEAYTAAQRLVVLTKTDMMSQLGLTVDYVDNDGD